MAVRVMFLGRLADSAGTGEMEVAPGALEEILARLDPELSVALLDERVRIAVNGEIVAGRGGIDLNDGDEIAFLPPVSGG